MDVSTAIEPVTSAMRHPGALDGGAASEPASTQVFGRIAQRGVIRRRLGEGVKSPFGEARHGWFQSDLGRFETAAFVQEGGGQDVRNCRRPLTA